MEKYCSYLAFVTLFYPDLLGCADRHGPRRVEGDWNPRLWAQAQNPEGRKGKSIGFTGTW